MIQTNRFPPAACGADLRLCLGVSAGTMECRVNYWGDPLESLEDVLETIYITLYNITLYYNYITLYYRMSDLVMLSICFSGISHV